MCGPVRGGGDSCVSDSSGYYHNSSPVILVIFLRRISFRSFSEPENFSCPISIKFHSAARALPVQQLESSSAINRDPRQSAARHSPMRLGRSSSSGGSQLTAIGCCVRPRIRPVPARRRQIWFSRLQLRLRRRTRLGCFDLSYLAGLPATFS
jgi:hypothetical protein